MAINDLQRRARVALTYLVSPTDQRVHTLVATDGPVGAYRTLSGVRSGWQDTLPARRAEIALRRTDCRLIVPGDPGWPTALDVPATDHFVPPLTLWTRGTTDLTAALEHAVTITGSRAATEYGVNVATDLGFGCAGQGWTIVAGGGFGIEAGAHRGALAADGITIAVLAGGLDRWYPAGHNALFHRIIPNGLLISEYPPGTEPARPRLAARQRLLATLTPGTVLVEAAP